MQRSRVAGTTVLITGGRAPVALDLARKFAAAGARVVVAESAAAQLCRRSRAVATSYRVPPPNREPDAFVDALAHIVVREGVGLIVPTCEEVFFVARGGDALRAHCAVLAEPLPVLRRLHSKWEFLEWARELGLPVPATTLVTSPAQLAGVPRPFVLKPVFSRFGTHVRVVTGADRAPEVEVGAARPWVAQELLVGRQICTYSVASAGRVVAHCAYATEFTAGPGACIAFEPVTHPVVDAWVRRFVAGSGVSGQLAFDFIVTAEGDVRPLECNPRATSGVHLLGADLPAALLAAATGHGGPDAPARPAADARAMITMAMLSFGLASVRSRADLRRWAQVVAASTDVIAVRGDRRPFGSQFAVLLDNAVRAVRTHRSMIECSTHDIAWDGA